MDEVERAWLLAEEVLGDKVKAAIWLRLPREDFDGRSAVEKLGGKAGCQRVI
ncbi:antitoxin Xre/MbcA/ParS toxin-binding domain-containing protein [Pseudomonas kurunegalensis]|uniref:antitoxin Xre/MbcA/ParS toxin-binding domain-containing protein n=1 Tax=Pseudomonas kurunegalensis TaxID=485880 RepID=UPI002363C521|nr:antitoxin Xre/MbcA/ParS toxin-binding domain-containing protein [Pseudomonas kurunegalensis]MDD2133468.1 MbcA/ParS/Xre antitoxin family protein [Pseudomonas kurunegalensis]